MYGFSIVGNGLLKGEICCDNFSIKNNFIDKFEGDKIFEENDYYIVILDGVILNKTEILKNSKSQKWSDAIISLYEEKGETFFSVLRGSFAGAFYNKKRKKWTIFSDQLGTKFLYYCQSNQFFCCSSVMGEMFSMLKSNNIKYNLDVIGAKMLLGYGFMLENYTLCKEIKKIKPGCYIELENNNIKEYQYYNLQNVKKNRITEKEAIEGIDCMFRQAVNLQFKKDEEYGYMHLCALSAGLDCRMTSFVAHDLGYTNQTNITFSQTNYYDDFVSKQMASDLRHEWVFKSLDDGNWLKDADEINKITGGNVLYYGSSHGNSLLRLINFSKLGLLHSGQLGDVVVSTHAKNDNDDFLFGDGAYSKSFIDDIRNELKDSYLNQEMGLWYCRYLNGTNNGQQNEYNYTETLSPFLYLDFLEFALSIPASIRYDHQLYKKWIISRYPKAAAYIWTGMGDRIDAYSIKYKGVDYSLKVFIKKILKKTLNCNNSYWDSKFNMNPVGYYYSTNEILKDYFSSYYCYEDLIEDNNLHMDVKRIIEKGNSIEQIQVHTLLSALKLYFQNTNE